MIRIEMFCGFKTEVESKAVFLKNIKWESCKSKVAFCPKKSMASVLGESCIKEIKEVVEDDFLR